MANTLVLGIGNTLLSDEGLGVHLLNYLRVNYPDLPGVTYLDGGTLSFTLATAIEDCDNLVVLDAPSYLMLPYRMGTNLVHEVLVAGRTVVRRGRRVAGPLRPSPPRHDGTVSGTPQ